MKHIVFSVDETKSYVKWTHPHDLKPGVTPPLIVYVHKFGTITLTIDENKNLASGVVDDLWFTTDKLAPNSNWNSTGYLQAFRVLISGLALQFDPTTGDILSNASACSTFVMGDYPGWGSGAYAASLTAPSSLVDKNSPSFDLSNGLGCGGGIILEITTGLNDPVYEGTDFLIIHVEATVALEDLNGDGSFEVVCLPKIKREKPWLRKKRPFPPPEPTPPPVRGKGSRVAARTGPKVLA